MEYTYRNSSRETPTTIFLSEFNMTIKQGKEEVIIPYASIVQVNLERGGDRIYKAHLQPDSRRPFLVTNKYHTSEKTVEDRSRAYSTFIRVLHFHLKDKSKAAFVSGGKAKNMLIRTSLTVGGAFAISFTADFLGIRLLDPILQGVLLSAAAGLVLLASHWKSWPKSYRPTDIPMEFLP